MPWTLDEDLRQLGHHGFAKAQAALALYARFHKNKNIGSAETAWFLRQLSKHLRGPVFVLWDSGSQHKEQPVRDFCADHPNWEFHRFPGYAPELNPDEFVWNLLKRAVLAEDQGYFWSAQQRKPAS